MREFEEGVVFSLKLKDNMLDAENELTGKLYVSNIDGITVEYTKSIKDPREVFKNFGNNITNFFTVYGQIAGGKKFTAYQCHNGGGHTNLSTNTIMTEKFTIEIGSLYIGEWLDEKNLLKIDKAEIRFSYLERWFQEIRINDGVLTNKPEYINIALDQFSKNLNVQVDDNLTISETRKWQNKTEYGKKNIFDVTQYIQCDFAEPVDAEVYHQTIHKLHNFYRLLIPKANIYLEEEHVTIEGTDIEICVANKHYTLESNKISRIDFLYLFNEETTPQTFKTWFSLYQTYGRVFNVLSSILDNPPFMYIEHSFLNLVQWYEGYCRLTYPTSEKEKSIFKGRISDIVSLIEDDDDKKLIQDIAKFSDETPLKKQLKKLFVDMGLKDILEINSKKLDSLIHHIGEYRNRLTHPDKDNNDTCDRLVRLVYLLNKMIFLIIVTRLNLGTETLAYRRIIDEIKFNYSQYIETKEGV